MGVSCLIYDFDGLLMNTEPIYCRVNELIAGRYGKQFTPEVHRQIMGRQAMDCARILVKVLELPLTPEEHLAARNELIFDMLPKAVPMPGARSLTQHFFDRGIPQAIATSSASMTFNLKTQRYGDWLSQFQTIVLGDDPAVKASKPAPDSFCVAASRLGIDPSVCLVLEDAPAGVTAAKQAGMSVVAVPARHMDKAAYAEADEVIKSLLDFNPRKWGLPD